MGNSSRQGAKVGQKLRAAVYLRVSTGHQDEANQEPATLAVCKSRGWTPVVFREVESGTKLRRPAWDQVREAARTGAVGAVVVYSVHRIGRRRTMIAGELADLARWGVALVSVRESFLDFDGTSELARVRDLLIQWWGWFAETERAEIADRTRAGLAKVRSNIATNGFHTSKSGGRRIVNLGRPGFGSIWRDRAWALHLEDTHRTWQQIAELLHGEGAPTRIGRELVKTWMRDARKRLATSRDHQRDLAPRGRGKEWWEAFEERLERQKPRSERRAAEASA